MIKKISKKLKENNIFHKVEGSHIITRKSKVKIPNLSKDMAYIVGVIAGDGSLSTSKREKGGKHHKLQITSFSEKHLKQINKIVKDEFNIEMKIRKDKRKERTYNLISANTILYWYFKLLESKYDCTGKLPKICENKNFFTHYMAGLIDTDGSVSQSKKRIQLKLKNKKVIEEIFSLISHANPNPPKINYTNKIPFYYIRFDNIFPLRLKTINFLKDKN
jgi:hypothetical protein